MREIKFRAWDSKFNEWMPTTQDEIVIGCDGSLYFHRLDDRNAPLAKSVFGNSRWKVVLYTGLKDKNGKKIFEGDILGFGEYSNHSGHCLHKVVWVDADAGYYTVSLRPKQDGKAVFPLDPTGVVIGNIYENPELLKGD